jgi:DNA-binding transcriptional MerR regulator
VRISGLSAATGVPVATIKFYLRQGLLPQGEATSATQAVYDDRHVQRLRLVRALVDVAGLSLAQVRRVVQRIDDPPTSWHDLLGVAHGAAQHSSARESDDGLDTRPARRLVEGLGWHVDPHTPALAQLQRAMTGLADAGLELTADQVSSYAAGAHQIAEHDVDSLPTDSPAAAARHVVLGTVLFEPLLLALRRLAHEDVSASRFAGVRRPSQESDG